MSLVRIRAIDRISTIISYYTRGSSMIGFLYSNGTLTLYGALDRNLPSEIIRIINWKEIVEHPSISEILVTKLPNWIEDLLPLTLLNEGLGGEMKGTVLVNRVLEKLLGSNLDETVVKYGEIPFSFSRMPPTSLPNSEELYVIDRFLSHVRELFQEKKSFNIESRVKETKIEGSYIRESSLSEVGGYSFRKESPNVETREELSHVKEIKSLSPNERSYLASYIDSIIELDKSSIWVSRRNELGL